MNHQIMAVLPFTINGADLTETTVNLHTVLNGSLKDLTLSTSQLHVHFYLDQKQSQEGF